MLARGSSSLLPLKIPNLNPAHFDGAGSRRLWRRRRRSVLVGLCGCKPVNTSYRVPCLVGPTQVYGRKLRRSELQTAVAGAEIGEGRSESRVGVSLFRQMGFRRFTLFHIFLLFTSCVLVISEAFFFFKTGAKPSPPIHFC